MLLVCPYDFTRPGGVQQHVREWAAWLNQNGHTAAIVAPRAAGPACFDTGPFTPISLLGTRYELAMLGRDKRGEFQRFLHKLAPDVVHYHAVWVPVMPLQVRRLCRARQVCTFHDTPMDGWQQPILRAVTRLASASLSPLFDAYISVSAVQRSFLWRGRLPQVSVIANGLDTERFAFSTSRPREPRTLLFLGRLEPRKGVLHALAVHRALLRQVSGLRLVIAGDGEQRAQAERQARQLPASSVEFLGQVSEERKVELLQTCTLLLAPALYGESFGLVLTEAMAAGLPVCGFRNAGYARLADLYDPSLFATPGDDAGLGAAAARLLGDAGERERLSGAGKTVAKRFSWAQIAPEILRVYGD